MRIWCLSSILVAGLLSGCAATDDVVEDGNGDTCIGSKCDDTSTTVDPTSWFDTAVKSCNEAFAADWASADVERQAAAPAEAAGCLMDAIGEAITQLQEDDSEQRLSIAAEGFWSAAPCDWMVPAANFDDANADTFSIAAGLYNQICSYNHTATLATLINTTAEFDDGSEPQFANSLALQEHPECYAEFEAAAFPDLRGLESCIVDDVDALGWEILAAANATAADFGFAPMVRDAVNEGLEAYSAATALVCGELAAHWSSYPFADVECRITSWERLYRVGRQVLAN